MSEMWKEIKFSLDLRAGDTKPVVKDTTSSKLGGSKSLLADASQDDDGDDEDTEHQYGEISDAALDRPSNGGHSMGRGFNNVRYSPRPLPPTNSAGQPTVSLHEGEYDARSRSKV